MGVKIAVIGANYQFLSFYRQAKALGYEIHSFARAQDDNPCWEIADHHYDCAFSKDKDKILEICRREGVQGVTSFLLESPLPCVYYVSEGLGTPCNSKECQALTANKYTMREQMRKCGVSIPAYQAIKSREEKISIPFPVIVKPSDSGGSRGVTLVNNQEELDVALDRAFDYSANQTVMIEQFIVGREFSIESISCKGKHYVLQITDKVTTEAPYFVELAHHQPADLTEKQRTDITNLTIQMLDALKIENSAGHTEIKMDKDGIPYVIEMGPRMGGDYISSDLVRLSTGYDFVKGVLEVATGQFEEPVLGEPKCSGVYFLCEETKDKVLSYIQNKEQYPFIFDADIWGDIQTVKCNSDRGGYFIYQANKKIII